MALPKPQLGLVISYAYLWHNEHRAGNEEGRKHRPCVIVVAIETSSGGATTVRVAPITHSLPKDPLTSFELPTAVNRHLGLDGERSWIILDEVNDFGWPGFDLRPIVGSPARFAYGFIPPKLFQQLLQRLGDVWSKGLGKPVPR